MSPTRPAPATHTRLVMSMAACVLAVCLLLLSAGSALAITRPAVLARAQSWVDKPVPYSQAKYHLGYRTDCSGYVSMCWQTGMSWSTATFHSVTHRIKTSELKPGDAMLKAGYHIRLFHNWANASHTSYVAYEAGTKVAVVRVHSLSSDLGAGYVPVRYNAILDGPQADEALWNGSFDAWAGSWGTNAEEPVMWEIDGPRWATLVVHRADVAHSGHNSLQLLASGDNHDTPTRMSQTAPVTPGAVYRLGAWARMPGDARALQLTLQFLAADGTSLAETSTSGADFGVDDVAFRQMSLLATAPAGTSNAVVTVQLAAPTGDASGPASVTLDDISLARPRAGASIKVSSSTARRGKTVALSGAVTPVAASGVTAVVWVKPPKQGWRRMAQVPVTAAAAGAGWSSAYAFRAGMRKGTYLFRVSVPAFPGYLGRTSSTVGVTLK